MKNYLSECYKSKEVAQAAAVERFADTIDLSVGDFSVTTDKTIMEKAFADGYAGYTKYGNPRGDEELRAEIAKFYKSEYDFDTTTDEVLITAGGCVAMYLSLKAILNEGDEVIILEPYFGIYPEQIRLAGGVPIPVKTKLDENFAVDFDALKNALTEKTKAIIINTPSNPSGVCFDRITLEKLADFAKEADIVVIADDIYIDYSFDNEFIAIATLPDMRNRTITINSFSKSYAMTGFRVANIVAPSYIIDVCNQINGALVYTSTAVSQRAALYALRDRERVVPKLVEEHKAILEYVRRRLSEMKNVKVASSGGTFYLFVDISQTGLDGAALCDLVYKEAHVIFMGGSWFGDSCKNYIRISCTKSMDIMKEAFDRLQKLSIFN